MRARLTYANLMSTIAVCLALGGGVAYAANTVFSTDIVDGEVKSADLATNAVTGGKLGNQSVTTGKIKDGGVELVDLAPDSVDGSKVLDSSLGAADLGFDSVGSAEIQTDAINGSEVAVNAIDSDEILDNSLTANDLGIDSVGAAEIADGAVGSAEIANHSISGAELDGGRSNGAITLNAGFVANGRCRDFGVAVAGAAVGDAVLFSINTDIPDGVLLSGVRVSSAGIVLGKACNLTGGTFPQLNGIQVAILTVAI